MAFVGTIAGLGCGSRTSALDSDAYGVGGSSSASSGIGGGSSGAGGKAGGQAGTRATAGAPNQPTPTATQCAQYCSGYATTCAQKLKGQNCQQVCAAEIDGFGTACQALGLAAIQCLTPFFNAGNISCDVATNNGLRQCGTTLTNFKSCEGGNQSTPAPAPTPVPTPTSAPTSSDPLACPNMGTYDANSCEYFFTCPEGGYTTICQPTPDGTAAYCTCYHGVQSAAGNMPLDFSVDCYVATSLCPK